MTATLAERSSDGPVTDIPTDELPHVESESPVTDSRESAEPIDARENRGVLNGLKVIGLA